MYTRCSGCHTVHAINAALLARGAGRYRCGKCNKVNNALESLFDEWPGASEQSPPAGDLPVLAASLDLKGAARARQTPEDARPTAEDAAEEEAGGRRSAWLMRTAWISGAITVLLIAAFQWASFQGEPLLERDSIRAALVRMGLRAPPPRPPSRNPDKIHVVSRELRSHPTLPGHLRLSATLVNRAAQTQPYPDIEVALLDVSGQVVRRDRFAPADYLSPGTPAGAGLAPHAYLPLMLDLVDPGERAVGFELNFK